MTTTDLLLCQVVRELRISRKLKLCEADYCMHEASKKGYCERHQSGEVCQTHGYQEPRLGNAERCIAHS